MSGVEPRVLCEGTGQEPLDAELHPLGYSLTCFVCGASVLGRNARIVPSHSRPAHEGEGPSAATSGSAADTERQP